ncbi:SDR family oxidoreductase [Bosea sp. (in: a-proteobacteria)]|uniref:SDR family oxidoreductase n=1 Tax=Bosea sp. (in: a-proteobacteria) TaxID=1871050 RepID=UPI00261A078A|nr:SDR family oxidoreductase [Bosea sp. (in: a-proteobacteria)]MCO5089647.1 SDR family oxidoreductase [Bosea sp. (in: a-proteobacteria)]
MDIRGRIVVVTGGASGIGRALCERFHADGAAKVIVADRDGGQADAVAGSVEGASFPCDVSDEAQVRALVDTVESRHGPIALFCSNAGIASFDALPRNAASAPNEAWAKSWAVNVMAHVYAVRALAPVMERRAEGYFLLTVSAAGLLSQIGGAPYATTKHAAIGFAEAVAIAHADAGIRVSVLCPQGVDTPMLRSLPEGPQARDGVMTAEDVAACAAAGIAMERFLILPHPQVADYMRRKTADYDRWLAGMVKLRRSLEANAS